MKDMVLKKTHRKLIDSKNIDSWTIAFFLTFDIINLGVNAFVNKFIAVTLLDSAALYFLLFAGFFCSLIQKNGIKKKLIFIYSGMLIIILVSLLLNSENVNYITGSNIEYFLAGFFAAILLADLKDFRELNLSMCTLAPIAIGLGAVCLFCETSNNDNAWMSDMNSAYSILIPVLFVIDQSFREKKMIIFAVLGTAVTLMFGSRGPVLIIVLFLAVSLFRNLKSKFARFIFITFCVFVGYVFISGVYIGWLTSLEKVLKEQNITLASIEKTLHYDDISNGRDLIYRETIDAITSHPILGIGVFGDRSFAVYTHNLFLELFVDFGVIFGSLISAFLIIQTSLSWNKTKKIYGTKYTSIMLVIFFAVYGQLMFSNSYLQCSLFFAMIGLFCLNGVKNKC